MNLKIEVLNITEYNHITFIRYLNFMNIHFKNKLFRLQYIYRNNYV